MLCTLTLPLPTAEGHNYYTLFYLLAFAVQFVLLLQAGYQRRYPLQTWLVLLAASTLAFIVGTKLITLPADAWPGLLHGIWPDTTARSVLGGGLGFAVVLLLLRRWLGFSWHVADAFAGPLCAGLVVQCIGCLLTGCCFGMPTDGSWGFTYAAGTLPYQLQLQHGLLETQATHSLTVHPTQLYTLLLCAGVWLTLHLTRHRNWPAGSWALLQAGLLMVGRLLVEFWRDPTGEPLGGATATLGGFQMLQLQWVLLPGAVLLLGSWGWLIYRAKAVTEEIPANRPVRNLLGAVGVLGFAALLPAGALTFPELLVVKAVLLTVVVMATASLLQGALVAQRAGLPLAALAVVLLFTNQVPADSVSSELEISLGAGQGAFYEDVTTGSGNSSGCGTPLTRSTYDHRYTVRGGTVELHRRKGSQNRQTTYGLGIWQGEDRVAYQQLDPNTGAVRFQADTTRRLLGVNPYIEMNSRLRPGRFGFGIRAGMLLGNLNYYADNSDLNSDNSAGNVDLGMWAGYRETLFMQVDANRGMLGVGSNTNRIALGSGLGKINGSTVLAGVALSRNTPNSSMGFVGANIRLGSSGFMLYPYGATNFSRHHTLTMQVGYRLPLNKRR